MHIVRKLYNLTFNVNVIHVGFIFVHAYECMRICKVTCKYCGCMHVCMCAQMNTHIKRHLINLGSIYTVQDTLRGAYRP